MNGLPYTVTSVTRHLDAAVEAAVDKAQRDDSTTRRLDRLAADLRNILDAYWDAYDAWAKAGSPLKSPTYDLRRTGKPGSRTPPEAEGDKRIRLVMAAQRMAMALRIAVRYDWLQGTAWHPVTLQRHHVVMRDPWIALPAFEAGEPSWRDPSDLHVTPPDVKDAVSQLRATVAYLQSVDFDAYDTETVADFLHEAEEAVTHVKRTGAWHRVMPTEVTVLCSRDGCWNEVRNRSGGVCVACTSREYRQRKKAS